MIGRLAIPLLEHSPAQKNGLKPDAARLEAIRSAVETHPGINSQALGQLLHIPRGSIGGTLVTLENNGILLTEDENGGLYLL